MWLAFDVGTTGTKGALLDDNGQVLRSAARQYPTFSAEGGIVEQNGDDWWQAVVEIAREIGGNRVRAIALTGQMQNLILVDESARLVRPVILYSDSRSASFVPQMTRRIDPADLARLTGNEQDASSLIAKLHYLKAHEPQALDAARHMLFGAADLIAMRMTGVPSTDTTTASTTGLLDVNARAFLDRRTLDALGIAGVDALYPHLLNGGTMAGRLSAGAAQALSLPAGVPVCLGPGDAGATTLGAGSGEAGGVYGYLGTSGWVGFTTDANQSYRGGTFRLFHPKPTYAIHVAPLLTAGGNLDWVSRIVGVPEIGELLRKALSVPPTPLIYLPYLNGERSPFRDAKARGAFVGISGATDHLDMTRAVLEGVVYAYRHALEALLGTLPQQLMLTGGGTRSLEWAQLFADALGLSVAVIEQPELIGVRGATLAAQVADGQYRTYQPDGYFPLAGKLTPSDEYRDIYDHKYALFRQAYPALKPIFHGV